MATFFQALKALKSGKAVVYKETTVTIKNNNFVRQESGRDYIFNPTFEACTSNDWVLPEELKA